MAPHAYIIETDNEAAGLALSEEGRFRFVASDSTFRLLDGRLFPTPAAAERAVRAQLTRTGRPNRNTVPRTRG